MKQLDGGLSVSVSTSMGAMLWVAAIGLVLSSAVGLGQAPSSPGPIALPSRFSVVVEGPAAGKAPDVILLPGLASSRDVYTHEAKLLQSHYRLHRVQIAGFAGEPAGPNASGPILAPVVDELHQCIVNNKLLHPALIAHSMGGLIGLMLADAHPEDVGKLLIVDAFPFYGILFGPGATVDSVRPQAQAFHDALLGQPEEQFAATQPMMAARMSISPEGQKMVAAGSIASDRRVFANAVLEDMCTDMRPKIATIKTPTTVIYPYTAAQGTKETVDSLYAVAYQGMPNVQLKRIDDSMHFIMLDQPEAFHRAVVAFLEPAK